MKKIIAVILSLVLLAISCVPAFAGFVDADDASEYPVVLVAGYSSPALKLNNADGTYTQVWGLDFDKVLSIAQEKAAQIALGAGLMTVKNYEYLAKLVGEEMIKILEPLKCNPDGTSTYDVEQLIPSTAEACRWSNMDSQYKGETVVMEYVQEYYSDEDIYNFNCDFRMGAVENANKLDELVTDIIDTTGCGKVNILCISHGGQITGTYLSLYGEKGVVNNVVMCMPAMGGSVFACDAMSGDVHLDEALLLDYIEYGQQLESDYHWLLNAGQLGFLDDFIAALLPYVYQIIRYWQSLWDFIPVDHFDDIVSTLDPSVSQPLIDSTTWYHENIMTNYGEALNKAKAAGVKISILSGSGIASVTGLQENSDAIIGTNATSGAVCAPFGQRFADGYECVKTSCSNPLHNHLSPSMEVDASACWLPDNTWFVDGLYHGMELFDKYTMDLVVRQLVSDNPMEDVYSDPAFSQFHAASSHSVTVHAKFNNSPEGYVFSEDNAVVIRNTTEDANVSIFSVKAQGIDISFNDFQGKTLKPGESVTVKFTGDVPSVSLTRCSLTVFYTAAKSLTPVSSRTLDFTIMNGAAPEYDSANPYADANFPVLPNTADPFVSDLIEKSGLTQMFNAIKELIIKITAVVKNIIAMISAVC